MSSCSRSASVLFYLMGELAEDEKALFEKHLDSAPSAVTSSGSNALSSTGSSNACCRMRRQRSSG